MNKALFIAACALALGALAWGFSVIGGPGYARMVKNDLSRIDAVHRLGDHYGCAEAWERQLNSDQRPTYCRQGEGPPPDLRDPGNGAPYAKTGDENAFTVCTELETTDDTRVTRRARVLSIVIDGQRACVEYVRKGKVWLRVS